MPLVTTEKMLSKAQQDGYAIGAFNVDNMEMVLAVAETAEQWRSPVIIQTAPSTLKYANMSVYMANVAAVASQCHVPIALHLDHGDSFMLAMQAFRIGYTSIMVDGSSLPYEENIRLVQATVDACAPSKIPVEAELGQVGRVGDAPAGQAPYTDPETAVDFCAKTGISSLAVAIGTAHGVYEGEPKLDLKRLAAIQKRVRIPLVLHGASGLSADAIHDCIHLGICKVNFATELRQAYTLALRKALAADQALYDPKKYGKAIRTAVKEQVVGRMEICGCIGKA